MPNAINLKERFSRFNETWSPQIVGELNGQHVKLAKLEEDKCPWHSHENEDELFLVVEGVIVIDLRGGSVRVGESEFHIVPKGIEHRVVPEGRAKVVLFEPATTAHTGKVNSSITRTTYGRLTE